MTTASLVEIATIHGGGKLGFSGNDFTPGASIPAYGAAGVNGYLEVAEYDNTDAVILSSIGARCGKCFFASGSWISLANTQVIVPDPSKADARFLWYQLNDESRWHRSGSAQPFIKPSDVKSHRVFLPPLGEQRRIAAILDQADAVRAKRRSFLTCLERLTKSTFHEFFGADHTRTIPLAELAEVSSGITKGRSTTESTTPVPYLAVSNVQAGHLKLDVVKRIEATDSELRRYALRTGDLVLTEGGDPDKLGRGTVWRGELPLCLHQNHIFRVRVKDWTRIHPDYLASFLSAQSARAYFLRCAKQTTGIASINITQLKALPVFVPPIQTQERFTRVRAAQAGQAKIAGRALASHDQLFASLQSRAFRGEL